MKPYKRYEIIEFWCSMLGISPASEGQIGRYNQSLKFCIFDERNGKHSRPHFHALLNGNKVASIYIHFVADMKDGDIEQWYDDIYQMCLLAFLELDHLERKERVKQLKEDIQKNG